MIFDGSKEQIGNLGHELYEASPHYKVANVPIEVHQCHELKTLGHSECMGGHGSWTKYGKGTSLIFWLLKNAGQSILSNFMLN